MKEASQKKTGSLRVRITLCVFIAVLVPCLVLIIISGYTMYRLGRNQVSEYKEKLTSEKKSELKHEVELGVSVIEQYHKLQEDGTMTEKQAMKAAADAIREMKYDNGNGYYWIDTTEGVNVVLLGRDTEGKNRYDAQDPNGVYYIREIIKNGMQNGGGYTDFSFPKPNETKSKPKIAYSVEYEPYDWVIGTGVWVDDIDEMAAAYSKDTYAGIKSAIVGMSVAGVLLALILIIIISFPVKKITEAINTVTGNLRKIAKGDLSEIGAHEEKAAEVQKKIESRDDELGVMAQSMGSLISELRGLMQKIHELTKYLATSAQQLTASAHQSAEASDSVAQSITNVAASCSNQGDVVNSAGDQTNIFSNDMSGFSDRLSASSEQINETTLAADEGRKQVNEAVEKIKVIEESVENTSKAVSQLGEQIGDIDDIVTDIQDIARQTNLLSLNASIEAARAGEAGKGFAVVASEIQTLAQQSSDSAGHIAEKISAIQSQSDIALNAMQSGLENVKGGASAVEGAGKAFEGIADMIEKVNVNAQEMQRVVESLTSGTESIKDAFSNIKSQSDSVIGETENVSAASEEQSASMQEIAEASKKLSEVAEQLEKAVAKFRL